MAAKPEKLDPVWDHLDRFANVFSTPDFVPFKD
jgi:hypothetical protein